MNNFTRHTKGKKGLEIGGPSPDVFNLGIYQSLTSLDNVDFGSNIWAGEISDNSSINFHGSNGSQIVSEATNLSKINNESYEVVISSHMLEHVANPIAALKEFVRVCKVGGIILLILPVKQFTFDHLRSDTTIEHLATDFYNNVQENDMTHFEEIIRLHDLSRDPEAGIFIDFVKRSLDNYNNRCLHHHVFSPSTIYAMFNFCKIDMLEFSTEKSYFALGRKTYEI